MEETYDDNVGIDGSLCFFTKGGTPEDVAGGDVGIPLMGTSGSSVRVSTVYNEVVPEDGPVRGLRSSSSINSVVDDEGEHEFGRVASMMSNGNGPHGMMKTTSSSGRGSSKKRSVDGSIFLALLEKAKSSFFASHHKHATNIMTRQVSTTTTQVEQEERHIQELDTQVTTVTSVTFLEFDSEMNHILNQNSTYFETSLSNGESISYPSISSTLDLDLPLVDQAEMVPGGVMLVLFGLNRENIMVQNTAVWGYKLDNCQGPAVNDGDSIGWTTLSDYIPPRAAFCEGVTDVPTNTPSVSPTPAVPSETPTTLAPVVDFVKASVTNSPTLGPKPVPAMSVSIGSTGKSSKTKSSKKCGGKSSKKNGSGCDMPEVDTPYGKYWLLVFVQLYIIRLHLTISLHSFSYGYTHFAQSILVCKQSCSQKLPKFLAKANLLDKFRYLVQTARQPNYSNNQNLPNLRAQRLLHVLQWYLIQLVRAVV